MNGDNTNETASVGNVALVVSQLYLVPMLQAALIARESKSMQPS